MPVRFYDYRPADLQLSNLVSDAADLLALPFADASLESVSCMHVVEHVGLGRYGDPLADAMESHADSSRARRRTLLFVAPWAYAIMLNAHRIYSTSRSSAIARN